MSHEEIIEHQAQTAAVEEVECAICGLSGGRSLFRSFDKMFPSRKQAYDVVRCRNCGLVYLNPRPAKAAKASLYDQDYLFNPGKKALSIEHYHPVIERLLRRKPGRVLDVGTGNSPFLPAMRQRGWDVYGTEVNKSAVDWFQQEHGISLALGELEDLGFETGIFDAVTIMGVLEHTPYPRLLLKEAYRILKDDGVLCLWGFNRSLEASLLGKYWLGFDTPRHLYSFSSHTLGKLLGAAGFKIEEIDFSPQASVGHSIAFALAHAGSKVRGVETKPDYLMNLQAPIRFLNYSLGRILCRFGMSSTMYVFATKSQ